MVGRTQQITPEESNELLQDFRNSIDHLDNAIVAILAERFRLTEKIGKIKGAIGSAPMDPEREQKQVEHYCELAARYGLNPSIVTDLMATIIEHVKERHKVLKGES